MLHRSRNHRCSVTGDEVSDAGKPDLPCNHLGLVLKDCHQNSERYINLFHCPTIIPILPQQTKLR